MWYRDVRRASVTVSFRCSLVINLVKFAFRFRWIFQWMGVRIWNGTVLYAQKENLKYYGTDRSASHDWICLSLLVDCLRHWPDQQPRYVWCWHKVLRGINRGVLVIDWQSSGYHCLPFLSYKIKRYSASTFWITYFEDIDLIKVSGYTDCIQNYWMF